MRLPNNHVHKDAPDCYAAPPMEGLRLARCRHGAFHLDLGRQTLHLCTRDLLMIARAINRYVGNNPTVLHELDADQWAELDRNIEHS